MKAALGKFRQGFRAVSKSARSVVSSDADISDVANATSKITRAFTMAVMSILITVISIYLAGVILATPGYLPGLVGQILAGYCINSGQCDLSITLPAFATAVIILTDLVIFLLAAVLLFADQPEDDVIDTISERINSLADSLEKRFDDLDQAIEQRQ